MKKANQFISLSFGDNQFLDILNVLGGATSLDLFLKAYHSEETKGCFPYEWFDSLTKLDCDKTPPHDSFFSKLKIFNPLEKEFSEFENLIKCGERREDNPKKDGSKKEAIDSNKKLYSFSRFVEEGRYENFS